MYPIDNSIVLCRFNIRTRTSEGRVERHADAQDSGVEVGSDDGGIGIDIGGGGIGIGIGGEVELVFPVRVYFSDLGDCFLDCAGEILSGTIGGDFEVPGWFDDGVAGALDFC